MTDKIKPEDIQDTDLDSATGGVFGALKPRLSPDKVRALRPTGLRQDPQTTGLRVDRKNLK